MIQNSKKFVTYAILRCSAFFDIQHAFFPNLRSSEVNEGQPEVFYLTIHLSGQQNDVINDVLNSKISEQQNDVLRSSLIRHACRKTRIRGSWLPRI